MEQNADDMPMERDPRLELQLEERYHQDMLQFSAVDALLHRVTDDAVLKWLYAISLSSGNCLYFTRGAARRMKVGESSRAQRGLHSDPISSIAVDLNSDSD